MSENKPTIDERLEALVRVLESFAAGAETLREQREAYEARQRRVDEVERRGRRAVLIAIGAYLEEARAAENGAES